MGTKEPPSDAEFATWLTPADVRKRMRLAEDGGAERVIRRHLIVSDLRAFAANVVLKYGATVRTARLSGLAPDHWSHDWDQEWGDFWRAGQITFYKAGRSSFGRPRLETSGVEVIATGVRIEPSGVNVLWPLTDAPVQKRTAGARRKTWWDDLWIEMIRRMEDGTLTPKRATELEAIMEAWCIDEGFSPGDSTLKPASLKLFKYLQERRGK